MAGRWTAYNIATRQFEPLFNSRVFYTVKGQPYVKGTIADGTTRVRFISKEEAARGGPSPARRRLPSPRRARGRPRKTPRKRTPARRSPRRTPRRSPTSLAARRRIGRRTAWE